MVGSLQHKWRSWSIVGCLLALLFLRGVSACDPEYIDPTNTPPPTHGPKAYLYVEIDWHARLLRGVKGSARDISHCVQAWTTTSLWGKNASPPNLLACEYRYDQNANDLSVTTILGDSLLWTSRSLLDATEAAGYDRTEAGTVLFMETMKTNRAKKPALYLLGAEFYQKDPAVTPYTWPDPTAGLEPPLPKHYLGYSVSWNETVSTCIYDDNVSRPVGVVFVSEIEKVVEDMNAYVSNDFRCGYTIYEFEGFLVKVVSHELFHQLFLSRTADAYPPGPGNVYCHDGDSDCECVMNVHSPTQIKNLISNTINCPTAERIVRNLRFACMERDHDSDGCTIQDIISYNPVNP